MPARLSAYTTMLLLVFGLLTAAPAQTFKVLHTFKGAPTDGEAPLGALVRDSAGNLYGTTVEGGIGECANFGCGTAFMLNKAGKLLGLYSFSGKNGQFPEVGLFRDSAGNLYGTTEQGGVATQVCGGGGCGVAFRLTRAGKEATYEFQGTPDGYEPSSPLVQDAVGNFYGTTSLGGTDGLGAVFKIDTKGRETVLYSFTGASDGCFPDGVILDAAGNLYGAAVQGGVAFCNSGFGTVYKLDTSGKFTVLQAFDSGNGAYPGLSIIDAGGNLYGETTQGGIGCGTGCGTLFELSLQPDGTWTQTVLHDFCSLPECADGESPGPVVMDPEGNLYGITYLGGAYRNCNGDGCGVVFELSTSGKETVLHNFTGGADGAFPSAGLLRDAAGNLYGVAQEGGNTSCYPPHGCGVVFELTP
jgi:uncharacterized repeat protein (TIGR03803 family)